MHCFHCHASETKVIDSRVSDSGSQVRRRRECEVCKERFTTYETSEFILPRIIKRDGTRVPFQEEKLRSGVMRALEKRPVPIEKIEEALLRIKHQLQVMGEREVLSRLLGEWVMHELKGLDQVAYVRFASVYRSFQDVHAFREEIDRLEDNHSR